MNAPTMGPDGNMIMQTIVVPLSFSEEALGVFNGEQSILIDRYANILAKGFDGITVMNSQYPLLPLSHEGMFGLWEVVELAPGEERIIVEPNYLPGTSPEARYIEIVAPCPDTALSIILTIGSTSAVYGDGRQVELPAAPQMVDDYLMLPYRFIIENVFGGEVKYDAATRRITATTTSGLFEITIGHPFATVNGQEMDLQISPVIIDGYTLVPLRLVEGLCSVIIWDIERGTVTLIASDHDLPR